LRYGKAISPATVNREVSILKTAYNKGIEWELVKENPIEKVKFFSERDRARTRYLSGDEKARLLASVSPQLRSFCIVALKTGMRFSEILGLKWLDIDPNSNSIMLRKTKAKTIRHIPIHPDVAEVLRSLPKRGDFVFSNETGNSYNRFGWFRFHFKKAAAQLGLRGVTIHTLRHTFASELVMKGADLKTVSELLGHSTTRMSERYTHLSPSHKALAVNLLAQEGKAPLAVPKVLQELEKGA